MLQRAVLEQEGKRDERHAGPIGEHPNLAGIGVAPGRIANQEPFHHEAGQPKKAGIEQDEFWTVAQGGEQETREEIDAYQVERVEEERADEVIEVIAQEDRKLPFADSRRQQAEQEELSERFHVGIVPKKKRLCRSFNKGA
ncbi:MAG: hypothetical protein Fur0016_23170 [Anaerolineales bacterium]